MLFLSLKTLPASERLCEGEKSKAKQKQQQQKKTLLSSLWTLFFWFFRPNLLAHIHWNKEDVGVCKGPRMKTLIEGFSVRTADSIFILSGIYFSASSTSFGISNRNLCLCWFLSSLPPVTFSLPCSNHRICLHPTVTAMPLKSLLGASYFLFSCLLLKLIIDTFFNCSFVGAPAKALGRVLGRSSHIKFFSFLNICLHSFA